ncbi:centrosomin isoform X3 [Cephus cinctus]|uniref:Centrosomin isoform X3 n=1 Tax=Cephus cinctus TaxID=211228 RepID=A0AAJ7BS55_CEPCN|nr:centrosomin isoform X3 [Cephus cinctus]
MVDFPDDTMMSVNYYDITNTPLPDITMSQTLPLLHGTHVRSPGKTSPTGAIGGVPGIGAGGRTMKEYEDQLEALKKENFNLKLRIYFLEERMGITSADEGAVKKNIELKVEVESLRKEVIEKQELLSQAAKAFELIEEQKEVSSRNQAQYQQSLETERERIAQLEKELEEYKEKVMDSSTYYKETFGITPEKALENEEKLHQMEELVASLEAEVKQITGSLEEERNWALELESERDQLKERLTSEIKLRETLTIERDKEIDNLREKVRDLEDQSFKKESIVQQYRNDLAEKERIIREKNSLLEEKIRAYEDLVAVSEKRKKQVDQLRISVKSRDDALTDLNNKHRTLLSQFENSNTRRYSPPCSPSTLNSVEDSQSPRMGQRSSCFNSPPKTCPLDWEPNRERSLRVSQTAYSESKELKELSKDLEDRERELKRQEEAKKQLILKLCNTQKSAESTEQRRKKLEAEHEKALKMIQGFMERQEHLEDMQVKKDRKIMELEVELNRLRSLDGSYSGGSKVRSVRRNISNDMTENPERDQCSSQRRFEEMESKINDLRDQIEIIKAEKNRLEKQIQIESEEVQEQLRERQQRIEILESERSSMKNELREKSIELESLKEAYQEATIKINHSESSSTEDQIRLRQELTFKNIELEEKNQRIDQLTKELQIKTQNLQKLVNTELWSKNKEIAKMHNHMTATLCHDRSRNRSDIIQESASAQLTNLIKELDDIGIKVKFTNEVIQLNYVNGSEPIDVKTMTSYVQKLVTQKNQLEKEVDYLKWLKLVTSPEIAREIDESVSESERAKKYCELLRMHLKDLMKFMKEMLRNGGQSDTLSNEHQRIVLDALLSSKILSNDFVHVLEGMSANEIQLNDKVMEKCDGSIKKSHSEKLLNMGKHQVSTQSDSEGYSEPDRSVSLARIGLLQETQQKLLNRPRFSKYTKTFSDSEDSVDYIPYHKTYQNDLNDGDASHQLQELKDTNQLLYDELSALRKELINKASYDSTLDDKLTPLIDKLEKSQRFCEKLQCSLERRIHECHSLKRESKQNSMRIAQLEKKIIDVESMATDVTKQKTELLQYKESAERKTAEMLITLNRENDALRTKIKSLEEENEAAKKSIATYTKELDHLTLSHSQILVENTKLTNEKLRLEQEVRKMESRYDLAVRAVHDKFSKEVTDLNQINESNRARMQELEVVNKELRRHVVVCEASDSAPSSSGISSTPTDATVKQTCDDIMQEYHSYNGSQYWLPINYPTLTGRSKSSCSPDLGIESDAAVTTTRPLKDTLKITESMTNLLSDDENCNNCTLRDLDSESPLPIEGGLNYSLNEVEVLKQENEALKRRLIKTRRALEDTFQHLSASNKNKKNVEKAITKQLMITKNILKKTRTYEEPLEN